MAKAEPRKELTFGERLSLVKEKINEPYQREKFEVAAANGVNVEAYMQSLWNACATVRMTERGESYPILNCTIASLAQSLMDSVTLGLPIGGPLAYGYVVPRKGKATFQAGYKGLLKLAYNDARATTATAEVVRHGDWFVHELGSEPHCRHKKTEESRPDADIEWAYAVIHVTAGPPFVKVWNSYDLKDHANKYVQRGQNGKFFSDALIVTNYEVWCQKTMLRRALKFMPMSETARRVLDVEEYIEAGIDPDPVLESGDEQPTESLRDAVKKAPALT